MTPDDRFREQLARAAASYSEWFLHLVNQPREPFYADYLEAE